MKAAILTPGVLFFSFGAGCRFRPPAPRPPAGRPATPSPPSIELQATHPEVRLFDTHGKTIAVLRGGQGAFQPGTGGSGVGILRATSATLFRDGKPALTLSARDVKADPARRVLTAIGAVEARTTSEDADTRLRAETMTWRYDANELTGRGDVLLTHGETVRFPARAFRADTRLRRVRFLSDDTPATGNL